MPPAIKVENLSKIYRLGEIGTGTISRDIERWFKTKVLRMEDPFLAVGETNDRAQKGTSDFVYSLRDIDFEIEQGDAVGIIGRNGAGKSTLLKILSRVTSPTTGRISLKGRVASLLEVGTGFHPELTGRENIYLNGAILGMRKREIGRKLDEIIQFSGVERYIDTPVKRYSSGMYVRLAFAVAAHLESEILIVDEVLAVGDAEFQKKCLGKMGNVSRAEGRTILFVSHNIAAIRQLCNKGIVLEKGQLQFSGSQTDAAYAYLNDNRLRRSYDATAEGAKPLVNENIEVLRFEVNPMQSNVLTISSGFVFELTFLNKKAGINLDVTFDLKSIDETTVFHHGAFVASENDSRYGIYKVTGTIGPDILNSGVYKFKLIFGQDQRYLLYDVVDIVEFEIMGEAFGNNYQQLPGVLMMKIPYTIEYLS